MSCSVLLGAAGKWQYHHSSIQCWLFLSGLTLWAHIYKTHQYLASSLRLYMNSGMACVYLLIWYHFILQYFFYWLVFWDKSMRGFDFKSLLAQQFIHFLHYSYHIVMYNQVYFILDYSPVLKEICWQAVKCVIILCTDLFI